MNEKLKARFSQMWDIAGAKRKSRIGENALISLEQLYSTPGRYYHTLEHVEDCLSEFDSARDLAENPLALEFAIWYHDIIYNPKVRNNEELSRSFMAGTLGAAELHPAFIKRTGGLILATKHDYVPLKHDEKLITDIDLSIFGQPEEKFDEYDMNIWREYAWIGPSIRYTVGRIGVLEGFLQRNDKHIYSTEFFRDKYEEKARSNLIRTVNILKGKNAEF